MFGIVVVVVAVVAVVVVVVVVAVVVVVVVVSINNINISIPTSLNCKSRNVIYLWRCKLCQDSDSYFGRTTQKCHCRTNGHHGYFNGLWIEPFSLGNWIEGGGSSTALLVYASLAS